MINSVKGCVVVRTYRETPCRANLSLPVFCPTEYFNGDRLSVSLFIGFYQPGFRTAPV